MAQHLEWENSQFLQSPGYEGRYIGTAKLTAVAAEEWLDEPTTRWPNVDRLRTQASAAYRMGLDVASAVVARVAVEEAIGLGLEDFNDDQPDMKAFQREDRLFENHLNTNAGFSPLDRNATRAALSAIRDAGNPAAHDGEVKNALLLELHSTILPQALGSLSNAVSHRL